MSCSKLQQKVVQKYTGHQAQLLDFISKITDWKAQDSGIRYMYAALKNKIKK